MAAVMWPAWLRMIRREDDRRRQDMEHREWIREKAEYERTIVELREQRDLETKRVHALDEERHALGHQVETLEAENERLRGLLREMTASLETQTQQSREMIEQATARRAEIDDVRRVLGAGEGETLLAAAERVVCALGSGREIVDDLRTSLAAETEINTTLRGQLATLRAEHEETLRRLAEAEGERDTCRFGMEAAEADAADVRRRCVEEIDNLRAKLAEAEERARRAEAERTEAVNDLAVALGPDGIASIRGAIAAREAQAPSGGPALSLFDMCPPDEVLMPDLLAIDRERAPVEAPEPKAIVALRAWCALDDGLRKALRVTLESHTGRVPPIAERALAALPEVLRLYDAARAEVAALTARLDETETARAKAVCAVEIRDRTIADLRVDLGASQAAAERLADELRQMREQWTRQRETIRGVQEAIDALAPGLYDERHSPLGDIVRELVQRKAEPPAADENGPVVHPEEWGDEPATYALSAAPETRCWCQREAGDSPCPTHGMDEPDPVHAPTGDLPPVRDEAPRVEDAPPAEQDAKMAPWRGTPRQDAKGRWVLK